MQVAAETDRAYAVIFADDLDSGERTGRSAKLGRFAEPMRLFVAGSKDFEEHECVG
jgi:hypothetical protein